jgi:peptidyl-prolyl cis-trans isomerase SurA
MSKRVKFFMQVGVIVLASMLANHAAIAAKKTQHLDRIIAVVNDVIITQSELDHQITAIKTQMNANNVPLPASDILRKQVLDQLINRKVQLQYAEQSGVTMSDDDVTKAIESIAKNHNVPLAELYKKVAEQGLTRDAYRKSIQEDLLLQRVQQQNVASKVTITPQEVDNFMHSQAWLAFNTKEYHLEDILIVLPETPSPKDIAAAKKRANETLAKIKKGMSFEEAAASESGQDNALQGGDLGWRKLPEIPAIFANELVKMKANELLGPIQAPNGFHIVKLAGIRSTEKQPDAAQMHAQVQQLIFQRKFEESLQNWILKIRSGAFIDTHAEK